MKRTIASAACGPAGSQARMGTVFLNVFQSRENLIMDNRGPKKTPESRASFHRPTRREFLKISALGAVAAAFPPAVASPFARLSSPGGEKASGNTLPGRIVILHDPEMEGHLSTINMNKVEENVHLAVRTLTGIGDTGQAFESLFPGVHSESTFAIKINLIGSCDTRWETARGVVSGLSLMLSNTYDVSQVIVFDQHSLSAHGYAAANFTFNGHVPVLSSSNNASGSGYQPWPGYSLSRYILNCDYVIDMPVLKSHYDANNQITVSLKNHYGSCSPSSLCGNIPGMLALNADSQVKNKTGLVLTDCLRATYNGGPTDPAQVWNTYAEGTPNTLFATTDPVTNDYWGREIINAERTNRGLAARPCPWVETASGSPYFLGVSDPGSMTVVNLDPYLDVESGGPGAVEGATFLAPNVPNPFRHTTAIRFRLERPGPVALEIFDVSGRRVRSLARPSLPGGYHQVEWDGRTDGGVAAAPGVYFVRMETNRGAFQRRIVMVR